LTDKYPPNAHGSRRRGLRVSKLYQARLQAQPPVSSRRRWLDALDATRQGIWEYDSLSQRVVHSPRWLASLGYADASTGMPLEDWFTRIHPDDAPRVRVEMRRHLAGEIPFYESLHRIRHQSGRYQWIQDRGKVVARTADGRPLRIIGTKMEASERQRFQEKLDRLADNVPGMLYQYQLNADGSSRFPYVSSGVQAIYGLTPEQLQHDALQAFARIHPEDYKPGMQGIRGSARTRGLWQAEYRVQHPERGERWVSGTAKPQTLDDGAVLWHGYIHDVTQDKQRTLKLQQTEHLLRQLMNEMPMALCLVDEHGNFYFRNRRFEQLFAIPPHEVMSLARWWQQEYPDPDYRQQVIDTWTADLAYAHAHDGQIPQRDYQVTLPDGEQRTMAIGGLVFGNHFMATFEDRTEQIEHNALLREMAYVDGLTGIANRRHFDESLHIEWRRCLRSGQPISMLMIDIDHFKAYNDHYGHLLGDECLQAVATTLRDGLGRAQDFVARYGGEEFVCLLPESTAAGARKVAERLLTAMHTLARAHAASPVANSVTISIGIATETPDGHNDPEALLAYADANLYRAKQAGRNRVDAGDNAG
jgi:diguanylate cyclase (GGDEF)-like protein/PAS domain S-box-containing protein